MVSKTFACCTITKLLKSSTLRVIAVRAATAFELESGIKPAALSSTGKRKFKTSFSTRIRAISAGCSRKILESSAQASSGVAQPLSLCSICSCGESARAVAAAAPDPELPTDLVMHVPRGPDWALERWFHAEGWRRKQQGYKGAPSGGGRWRTPISPCSWESLAPANRERRHPLRGHWC